MRLLRGSARIPRASQPHRDLIRLAPLRLAASRQTSPPRAGHWRSEVRPIVCLCFRPNGCLCDGRPRVGRRRAANRLLRPMLRSQSLPVCRRIQARDGNPDHRFVVEVCDRGQHPGVASCGVQELSVSYRLRAVNDYEPTDLERGWPAGSARVGRRCAGWRDKPLGRGVSRL